MFLKPEAGDLSVSINSIPDIWNRAGGTFSLDKIN
jgi:hypothetical protein